MMAGSGRYEKEVTIGFNATEDTAELYTADPVWMRKLDKLVGQNPEQFKPGRVEICKGEVVAKRYSFPRSNEPSSRACTDIWRMPRGSDTPQLSLRCKVDAP